MRVLGSAAGGGVPQWNCACANCAASRAGSRPRRSQSSFAISHDGARWWLVNASPDIAAQIEAAPALQPKADRGTPISGMLFTDANVDHMGGLAVMRQAGDHAFALYSTATVRELAMAQTRVRHVRRRTARVAHVRPRQHVLPRECIARAGRSHRRRDTGIRRAAAACRCGRGVRGRRCGHGRARVVRARFSGRRRAAARRGGRSRRGILRWLVWSDDELGSVGVEKAARALGHAPAGGIGGSLAMLSAIPQRGRRFFAHLNNTNPLLDPASDAHREMVRCGFELADDGMELTL